ncbi:MAG: SAM-dependent methyltransferase, partial [Methylophilaceae bacterium]
MAKKILLKKLAHLQMGKLHIVDGQEHYHFGQESEISGLTKLSVRIDVLHPQFYSDVVFGGSIGAGEAYMSQYFECDNLTALIRLMVRNQSLLDNIEKGFAKLTIPL